MQTAHHPKESSGSITITHPFHPLRGQTFEILRSRSINESEVFSLKKSSGGTIAVPRDWTDQRLPSGDSSILDIECLLKLIKLLTDISKTERGVDG
ncbi:Uncharacterized protein SCG7086_DD_00010 [Chlamydiales bacterium SCGC AG-110-P3]|nr:Uncharacterized protein SCG7086_DD_00010 [Chlamydiales bacterium SCGC AG-110-P3]